MATKPFVLRLSEDIVAKIQKFAEVKKLPFATTCRLLMVERLKELEELETPTTLGDQTVLQGLDTTNDNNISITGDVHG